MTKSPLDSVPIFCLTLPESQKRQANYRKQMTKLGLEFTFVNGVLGKNLSPTELSEVVDENLRLSFYHYYAPELTPGEIGCALGHIRIIDAFLATNQPLALIMEDDAILGQDLPAVLNNLIPHLDTATPRLILLTQLKRYYTSKKNHNEAAHVNNCHYQVVNVLTASFATGYLLTRSGAEVLKSKFYPIWCVIDHWAIISQFIPVYGLNPFIVHQPFNTDDSLIKREREINKTKWQIERRWRRLNPRNLIPRLCWQIYRYGLNLWHWAQQQNSQDSCPPLDIS